MVLFGLLLCVLLDMSVGAVTDKNHDHPTIDYNPVLGNKFSISHTSTKKITFCTVKEPFHGKSLHFSNPPDEEYPDVPSADNGRVMLEKSTGNQTVCKVNITSAKTKDDGVWEFVIGTGRNRKYKETVFNYTVHLNETTSTCENKESFCDVAQPNCELDYVKESCEKHCDLCPPPPPPSTGTCVNNDTDSNCDGWKGQGFCKGKHSAYMLLNCKKSCELCNKDPDSGRKELPTGGIEASFSFHAPPKDLEIAKMTVAIGTDGTDDQMSIKICSDVNVNDCCNTNLDNAPFGEEETIGTIVEFGSCQSRKFQILDVPQLSVTKIGTNNLKVNSLNFFMKDKDDYETKFSCGGFGLLGNCVGVGCTFKFENCIIA